MVQTILYFCILKIEQRTKYMKIETHLIQEIKVAEIITDKVILKTIDDGLDLIGNLYYQGYDKIIMYDHNITPDFFDLKTKIAGDILQKFAQYQMSLTIIGDFSKYNSERLNEFIFESNKGKRINFVRNLTEALS